MSDEKTTPKVSSLEEIRTRLQARQVRDVSKLPTHEHEALGTVYIAPMSTAGYGDVEAVDYPNADTESWSVAERVKFREANRVRAYFKNAILTGDGKRLPDDLIEMLVTGDFGAENKKLLNAIQKQNPPRETLLLEFQAAIATSRLSLVLYRLLKEAKCLKQMRDYFLAGDDEKVEERKALAEDLQKWEDALLPFEALMEADEAAKAFGIGVYDRKNGKDEEMVPNEPP
jgi:hypothetical protein